MLKVYRFNAGKMGHVMMMINFTWWFVSPFFWWRGVIPGGPFFFFFPFFATLGVKNSNQTHQFQNTRQSKFHSFGVAGFCGTFITISSIAR